MHQVGCVRCGFRSAIGGPCICQSAMYGVGHAGLAAGGRVSHCIPAAFSVPGHYQQLHMIWISGCVAAAIGFILTDGSCLLVSADVHCWAFCPPGASVSANLSAAMEPCCTSIIVGKVSSATMSKLYRDCAEKMNPNTGPQLRADRCYQCSAAGTAHAGR